jgi:hypothetical protein
VDAVPKHCEANIPQTQDERYKLQSLLQHRPIKVRSKELPEIIANLSSEDLMSVMDLRAFMQLHPWTLPADAPLSHAYRVFRTMGLRQLYVTPPKPAILGLITRKDLTEEAASLKIGESLVAAGVHPHCFTLLQYWQLLTKYERKSCVLSGFLVIPPFELHVNSSAC